MEISAGQLNQQGRQVHRLWVLGDRAPFGFRAHMSSVSVVTGLASPLRAAITACQARMAHLTRAGNLCTPANTASFPTSPLTLPVITNSWTWSNIFWTCALVLPLTL